MRTLVKLLMLLTVGALICMPGMASATVLTFDDIPNVPFTAVGAISPNINNLSTNYGGFTWTGGVQNGFWGVLTKLLTHNLDITTSSLSPLEQTFSSMKMATSDHRLILYPQRPRSSIMGPILRRGAPMITLPIMVRHS